MGIETAIIASAVIGTALSAASTVMGIKSRNAALEAQFAETHRQQQATNDIAHEQARDRKRLADKQIGSLRAAMADLGGLGTVNEISLAGEIGANEGFDLARIEGNRERQVASLQSGSNAARAAGKGATINDLGTFAGSAMGTFTSTLGAVDTSRTNEALRERARNS